MDILFRLNKFPTNLKNIFLKVSKKIIKPIHISGIKFQTEFNKSYLKT